MKKFNMILKIKDSINLEQLKNFGFEESKRTWDYWISTRRITIYKSDKKIRFNGACRETLIVLYDLTKADFVEVVEE